MEQACAIAGALRGRASGVAVVRNHDVARYPQPVPVDVFETSRVVETLVHMSNGIRMYVASLYGPAYGRNTVDPNALISRMCDTVLDHALEHLGPAIIMGDFNVGLEEMPMWPKLQSKGWVDAALFHAHRLGRDPRPTSRGVARKTLILINAALLPALLDCDTQDDFAFDTRPLLLARFDFQGICQSRLVWRLPESTDNHMFDRALFHEVTK